MQGIQKETYKYVSKNLEINGITPFIVPFALVHLNTTPATRIMANKYLVHFYHQLLSQRTPIQNQRVYLTRKPYDNLGEAFRILNWHDQRMFFRDLAWDHGFFVTLLRSDLVQPGKGVLCQTFGLSKATAASPAGVYLYVNTKAVSLTQLECEAGFNFSEYERREFNNQVFYLLTSKRALKVKEISERPWTYKRMKFNREVQLYKSKGPSP